MKECQHCGKPIEWDAYWTAWDHVGRDRKLTAELCDPSKPFGTEGATSAWPKQTSPSPAAPTPTGNKQ